MSGRSTAGTVASLFALLAVALQGCWRPADDVSPRSAVFIVVDTLRWDHVGAYGNPRDVSPAIDALAEDGIRFERAYSPAPWTKPTVASLLTGMYPSRHGVQTMKDRLEPEASTVAEILGERGFRTGAVVSHILLAEEYENGFGQGFDTFHESASRDLQSTPRVTDQAIDLLRDLSAEGDRFFLFVHYFDPHFEYLGHPEYGFAASEAGRLDGTQGILELREMRASLTPTEISFLVDRYDEEIRFTDAGIGRLLAELDALGLRDETIVVLTADHGEEFLERGWLGHTRTLYEELIRVPLIVRRPGDSERRGLVEHPVSTVAIPASLISWLGLDAGETRFDEPSLTDPTSDAAPHRVRSEVDWEPASALHKLGPVSKTAVIGPRFKQIRDASGAIEIYDLIRDPGETEQATDVDPKDRQSLLAPLR